MYFFLNLAIILVTICMLIGVRTILTLIPNERACMVVTLLFLGAFIAFADEAAEHISWLWDGMSGVAVTAALLSAWLTSAQWRESVSKRQFI